ncbi:ras-related protein Rab-42 isoform X2 [Saimiri boliviensis]|uniref:ras-related protein Rab-42 isoform X2 n=1 Tax=Saimiri boliviensis TaxID=27679 RepID=UPI00193EB9FA|nr:ras-related protein Rab-42 isoform X2 [Saimiri boliviensis boliviensis]
MEVESCRYQFRVALLGDAAVGKTSLLQSYVAGAPGAREPEPEPEPTVGAECYRRALQLRAGPRVKLQLWDTAGQEHFSSLETEEGESPEVRSLRPAWPTLVKPCLY